MSYRAPFACRFCDHDKAEHNGIVGCPHCRCLATPSEASPLTDEELDRAVRSSTSIKEGFEKPSPVVCEVRECQGGRVRVPVIVEEVNYGQREKFVQFDDVQCYECRGTGRKKS